MCVRLLTLRSPFSSFSVFVSAEQPSPVDPVQPLVNAIRSDSALIGGNVVRLSQISENGRIKIYFSTF